MEHVLVKWLGDGSLPIFEYVGIFQYLTGGSDDKIDSTVRWHPAASARKSAICPIIEMSADQYQSFVSQPVPEGHTLYVAIRSVYQLGPEEEGTGIRSLMEPGSGEGTIYILGAVGLVPAILEGAVPISRFEQPTFFEKLVLLGHLNEQPALEPLRSIWQTLQESRAESRAWHKAWKEAGERAKKLLVAQLDETQLAEFKERARFRVKAEDGHTYLIFYETHGNIFRIREEPDGKIKALINYCIVTSEHVPIYDQMLGQKLLLETDLEAFFSIANSMVMSDKLMDQGAGCETDPEPPQIDYADLITR